MPDNPMEFSSYIAERTTGFTGREWVFEQVDAWLADPTAPPLFRIAGLPGAGKTAAAARLVQFSLEQVAPPENCPRLAPGWLAHHHFCQASRDSTLEPLRWVESVSLTLANAHPAFRQALAQAADPNIRIDADLSVGTLAAGAQARVIGSLHVHGLNPRRAFDRAVRKPLEALVAGGPPLVLLLDSLDEARTYGEEDNLAALLAHLSVQSHDLPPFVRWLVTSRLDERLELDFGPPALDLAADAPPDVNDVRRYAAARLQHLEAEQSGELAERITAASQGNFLYARYVLDDFLAAGDLVPGGLSPRLPDGLDGIYREFITRELARSLELWNDRHGPLLGLLAVARSPGLDAPTLAGAAGLKPSQVRTALQACSQFLTQPSEDGPAQIYHQSFREYLLSNREYPVDPAEAHQALAGYFIEEHGGRWANCTDEYSLRNAAYHLAQALLGEGRRASRRGRLEQLHGLLTDYAWLQARLLRGPASSLIADLRPALPVLAEPGEWGGEPEVPVEIRLVFDFLRLAAHILNVDPQQLPSQLHGRLPAGQSLSTGQTLSGASPGLQRLLAGAAAQTRPWLRPLSASLVQPGGDLLRTLTGHQAKVNAVAITPDGRTGVSACEDGTLRIWDLEAELERSALSLGAPGLSLALLPAGQALCGTQDGRLLRVDIFSGRLLRAYPLDPPINVRGLAVTPDGRLALAGTNGPLLVVDLETGAIRHVLSANNCGATNVTVSPDGRLAYAGGVYDYLAIWDLEAGQLLSRLPQGQDSWVSAMAITPDGRLLVSGDDEGRIIIWHLQQPGLRDVITTHRFWRIAALAVTPDGQRFISAGGDLRLIVWELPGAPNRRMAALKVIPLYDHRVNAIAITPDCTRAFTAAEDFTLKAWDLRPAGKPLLDPPHVRRPDPYDERPYSPPPLWSAGASVQTRVSAWGRDEDNERIPTALSLEWPDEPARQVVLPQGWYAAGAVAGERALFAGSRGLKLWALATGSLAGEFAYPASQVERRAQWAALNPDASQAVLLFKNGSLQLWDLAAGQPTLELAGAAGPKPVVSPDWRWLCAQDGQQRIKLWGLADGQTWLDVHTPEKIFSWQVAADYRRLLVVMENGPLYVWNLENLPHPQERLLLRLEPPPGGRLQVFENGYALSASLDGETAVWDLSPAFQPAAAPAEPILVERWNAPPGAQHYDLLALPGGRPLALSSGVSLQVWDVRAGTLAASFTADSPITSARFEYARDQPPSPAGRGAESEGLPSQVVVVVQDARGQHRLLLEL